MDYTLGYRKYIASFLCTILALIVGPSSIMIACIAFYYIASIIIYIITSVSMDGSHDKRKMKRRLTLVQGIIVGTSPKMPDYFIKLNNWLLKEGFSVKVKQLGGALYISSKTVHIDFFPTLNQKISIRCAKDNNDDYLIYNEDQELKLRLEDYLDYLTAEADKAHRKIKSFELLNNGTLISQKYSFGEKYWHVFIRLQGYIFLILAMLNFQPNNEDIGFLKVMIGLLYLITEAVFI